MPDKTRSLNVDKERTFTCAECGERRPLPALSQYSLKSARTRVPGKALLRLYPSQIVCSDCEDTDWDLEDLDLEPAGIRLGRNDIERFELDGLSLDPAKATAYWLSH